MSVSAVDLTFVMRRCQFMDAIIHTSGEIEGNSRRRTPKVISISLIGNNNNYSLVDLMATSKILAEAMKFSVSVREISPNLTMINIFAVIIIINQNR